MDQNRFEDLYSAMEMKRDKDHIRPWECFMEGLHPPPDDDGEDDVVGTEIDTTYAMESCTMEKHRREQYLLAFCKRTTALSCHDPSQGLYSPVVELELKFERYQLMSF